MSTELQIGDRIKDNDPRMGNRILKIIELRPNGVVAEDSRGRLFGYLRRRIYTDGKPRRNGFSLINGQEPAEPEPRATELPKVEWPIPHPGGDWPKPKTGEAA